MKANPILEEVRRIKVQLAAEAGYDIERFFAQLRTWAETHPQQSQAVRNAEVPRQLAGEENKTTLSCHGTMKKTLAVFSEAKTLARRLKFL